MTHPARHWHPTRRIALVTPSANPAVEHEMRHLLAPEAALHVMRMPVMPGTTLEQRNAAYVEALDHCLDGFGALPLDAAIYGITGPSYAVLPDQDAATQDKVSAAIGRPMVLAARGIAEHPTKVGAAHRNAGVDRRVGEGLAGARAKHDGVDETAGMTPVEFRRHDVERRQPGLVEQHPEVERRGVVGLLEDDGLPFQGRPAKRRRNGAARNTTTEDDRSHGCSFSSSPRKGRSMGNPQRTVPSSKSPPEV